MGQMFKDTSKEKVALDVGLEGKVGLVERIRAQRKCACSDNTQGRTILLYSIALPALYQNRTHLMECR